MNIIVNIEDVRKVLRKREAALSEDSDMKSEHVQAILGKQASVFNGYDVIYHASNEAIKLKMKNAQARFVDYVKDNFSKVVLEPRYPNYRDKIELSDFLATIAYKWTGVFSDKYDDGFDVDVSPDMIIVYGVLWNDSLNFKSICPQQNSYGLFRKWEMNSRDIDEKGKGIVYRGDTMTSFWTTLKQYLRVISEGKDILDEKGNIPSNVDMNWFEMVFSHLYKNTDLGKKLESKYEERYSCADFIKYCYTIGNFIPVPESFNSNRSGFCGFWDYWDLTLMQIYKWYTLKEKVGDEPLELMLIKSISNCRRPEEFSKELKTAIDKCKSWLACFNENGEPSWKKFVELNYLDPFIKNGRPIMFWEGHSYINPVPETEEQFEQFFDQCTKCIKRRGEQMVKILREELRNND